MNAIVVYASKYGSTEKFARVIAQVLGEVSCQNVTEVKEINEEAVILGTPIYAGRFLPEMSRFLQEKRAALLQKKLFFFIVCADRGTVKIHGEETGGIAYLHQICDFFEGKIGLTAAFSGKMVKAELLAEDQAILHEFSELLGVQFPDFSGMDFATAEEFARQIQELL